MIRQRRLLSFYRHPRKENRQRDGRVDTPPGCTPHQVGHPTRSHTPPGTPHQLAHPTRLHTPPGCTSHQLAHPTSLHTPPGYYTLIFLMRSKGRSAIENAYTSGRHLQRLRLAMKSKSRSAIENVCTSGRHLQMLRLKRDREIER